MERVRVLARMLCQLQELSGDLDLPVTDHRRRAKRRLLGIMNAKKKSERNKLYMDLLKVTRKTVGYAQSAVPLLKEYRCVSVSQIMFAENLAEG